MKADHRHYEETWTLVWEFASCCIFLKRGFITPCTISFVWENNIMQQFFHWWKRRRPWLQGISSLTLGVGILALLIGGYLFHWHWTGFDTKTLWDWMQLLIIPAALAVTGYLFNRAERQSEQQAAQRRAEAEQMLIEQRSQAEQQRAEQRAMTERFLLQWRIEEELKRKEEYQREELLQAYLNCMSELLIDKGLRSSNPGDELRHVARARTLTALQRLNPERKVDVLWFLYESNLLDLHGNKQIVDVRDADWSRILLNESRLAQIDLREVNLSHAQMQGIDLRGASLQGALLYQVDLRGAILRGANLSEANLTQANLNGADLTGANLKGADLSHADLTHAILQKSNLRNATLQQANLSHADLQEAIYDQEQLRNASVWGIIR